MSFQIGDIYQDANILEMADRDSDAILSDDKMLQKDDHQKLAGILMEKEESSMDMRSI